VEELLDRRHAKFVVCLADENRRGVFPKRRGRKSIGGPHDVPVIISTSVRPTDTRVATGPSLTGFAAAFFPGCPELAKGTFPPADKTTRARAQAVFEKIAHGRSGARRQLASPRQPLFPKALRSGP